MFLAFHIVGAAHLARRSIKKQGAKERMLLVAVPSGCLPALIRILAPETRHPHPLGRDATGLPICGVLLMNIATGESDPALASTADYRGFGSK
jgi:hypothetical protein